MKRLKFPYLTLRGRRYPLIPLRIFFMEATVRTYALADSGSTLSVFRAEIADSLGLKVEDGEEMVLQSANASRKVFVHRLGAEVEGESFNLRIGFTRDLLTSFNILGREGFFERFRVTFDERRGELILEK